MLILYNNPYNDTDINKVIQQFIDLGIEVELFNNNNYYCRTDIINWGHFFNKIGLNKEEFIKVADNKLKTLQILKENGFKVPKFSKYLEDLSDCEIVFARDLYHFAGKDIIVLTKSRNYYTINKDFYVEFLPKDREFRVHIVCGDCVSISEKIGNKSKFIWNYKNGFSFVEIDNNKDLANICIEAMKVLKGDFGAFDVIYYKNEYYILEVNITPGLAKYRVKKYIERFKKYFEKKKEVKNE